MALPLLRRNRSVAFNPLSLSPVVYVTPGPQYCFSDDGVTPSVLAGAVKRWVNRGTIGGYFEQTNAGKQPTLRQVDGRYAVRYDGTDDFLEMADSAGNSITSSLTLAVKIRTNSAVVQQGLIEKYAASRNGYIIRITGTGKLLGDTLDAVAESSTTGSATVSTTTTFWASYIYNGATGQLFFGNALDASAVDTVTPTDGAATLKLGGRGDDGSNPLSGDMEAAFIAPYALSLDQLARLVST